MEYYPGHGKSLREFLYDEQFHEDLKQSMGLVVDHQTRTLIASQEALAREQLTLSQSHPPVIVQAFGDSHTVEIYNRLDEISGGITRLGFLFEEGTHSILTELGSIGRSLEDILDVLKTPIQRDAYNHFEIARQNWENGHYAEALVRLEKAIDGEPNISSGYPEGWEFHYLKGRILLGSEKMERNPRTRTFIDPKKAEEAFVKAARYSKKMTDWALAKLGASRAAERVGDINGALKYATRAIQDKPGGAILIRLEYQVARLYMLGSEHGMFSEPEGPHEARLRGLEILESIIDREPLFMMKAADDGAFQKHKGEFTDFLARYRLKWEIEQHIRVLEETSREQYRDFDEQPGVQELKRLHAKIPGLPTLDLIHLAKDNTIETTYKNTRKKMEDANNKREALEEKLKKLDEYQVFQKLEEGEHPVARLVSELVQNYLRTVAYYQSTQYSEDAREIDDLIFWLNRIKEPVDLFLRFVRDVLLHNITIYRSRKAYGFYEMAPKSSRKIEKELGEGSTVEDALKGDDLDRKINLCYEWMEKLKGNTLVGDYTVSIDLQKWVALLHHSAWNRELISAVNSVGFSVSVKVDIEHRLGKPDEIQLRSLVDSNAQVKPTLIAGTVSYYGQVVGPFYVQREKQRDLLGERGLQIYLGDDSLSIPFITISGRKIRDGLFSRVIIDPFEIQKSFVTRHQWGAVMEIAPKQIVRTVYGDLAFATREEAKEYCARLTELSGKGYKFARPTTLQLCAAFEPNKLPTLVKIHEDYVGRGPLLYYSADRIMHIPSEPQSFGFRNEFQWARYHNRLGEPHRWNETIRAPFRVVRDL